MAENKKYTLRHYQSTSTYKPAAKRGALVYCFERNQLFTSIRAASEATGIGFRAINHCVRGRSKTGGGLHWAYAETLCWSCQNCYGGCSWTAFDPILGTPEFIPVDGWVAVKVRRIYNGCDDFSYHVIRCPAYLPEER